MNDQTRWRTDDAAPLQGKVTLEPAPSVASEAQPPAPALALIHISEPTRPGMISSAVF
nr:hypothetical protein [Aeromonas caviae]